MSKILIQIKKIRTELTKLEKMVAEEPEKEEKPEIEERTEGFKRFWAAYPNKIAPRQCLAKWKARKLDKDADKIIADVKMRRQTDEKWQKGIIPNPQTYLNQDRWLSEIKQAPRDSENYRPKITKAEPINRGNPEVARKWLDKIKSPAGNA